jgi:hypothetical protein
MNHYIVWRTGEQPMASGGEKPPWTLYVRSEQARAGPQWGDLETTGVRLSSMVVPALVLRPRPSVSVRMPPELAPLHLPLDQAQCVRLIVDLAAQQSSVIRVVDVSALGISEEEVQREIGTGGAYPILVRADGAYLAGPEYFTPSRLRKFLRSSTE